MSCISVPLQGTMAVGHIHSPPSLSAGAAGVQSTPAPPWLKSQRLRQDQKSPIELLLPKETGPECSPELPGTAQRCLRGAGAAWAHPAPQAGECTSQTLSTEPLEVQRAAGAEEQEGSNSGTRD